MHQIYYLIIILQVEHITYELVAMEFELQHELILVLFLLQQIRERFRDNLADISGYKIVWVQRDGILLSNCHMH